MTTQTKLSKIPEELFGSLKEGVQQILNDKDWAGFLDTMRKIHHYSFNNRFLIALEQQRRGYGISPLVAGFKTWKTKFKRTVRKGEKSIHILAPVMYTVTDDAGNPLFNDEGNPIRKPYRFKTAHVFDHHQTEGEPISEPDTSSMLDQIEADISQHLFNGLCQVATKRKLAVQVDVSKEEMGAALGQCWFTGDEQTASKIKLVEGLNAATTFSVMSHELGHAILHNGHEYRIDTPGSIKELEAESVAYLVCSHYNIDMGKRSFKYIVHHNMATDDVLEEITKSGKRIFDAYEMITNTVDSYLSKQNSE